MKENLVLKNKLKVARAEKDFKTDDKFNRNRKILSNS